MTFRSLEAVNVRTDGHNQWRTEGWVWGVEPPPLPKSRRPSKIVPNSIRLWKLLKIAEFRTPTPQDVRKKGSKILKLPSVRSCFILAMTDKLVFIINSLKVPKIKKILLYEMKFLVPNYSCLQNPWLGGYRPQIPFLSVLNWICLLNPPPLPRNKIPGYATGHDDVIDAPFYFRNVPQNYYRPIERVQKATRKAAPKTAPHVTTEWKASSWNSGGLVTSVWAFHRVTRAGGKTRCSGQARLKATCGLATP